MRGLQVVKQCVATDGVEAQYVREEILPEFFKHFWVRRMALEKRNYAQLVETTVELANKVRFEFPQRECGSPCSRVRWVRSAWPRLSLALWKTSRMSRSSTVRWLWRPSSRYALSVR